MLEVILVSRAGQNTINSYVYYVDQTEEELSNSPLIKKMQGYPNPQIGGLDIYIRPVNRINVPGVLDDEDLHYCDILSVFQFLGYSVHDTLLYRICKEMATNLQYSTYIMGIYREATDLIAAEKANDNIKLFVSIFEERLVPMLKEVLKRTRTLADEYLTEEPDTKATEPTQVVEDADGNEIR